MEISSNIDAANGELALSQDLMVSNESKLLSSETLHNAKSTITNVASTAFQRLALAWSNIRDGVSKLFTHGAEKFQAADNKMLGAAHLFLSVPASMLYSVPAGVMGLFGMNITPYLDSK